jgi:hypothetical protein
MAVPFAPALVTGAALLAVWIDARFPNLAPRSLARRAVAAALALVALQATPVLNSSVAALYGTVFALLLPVLVTTFLGAVWLLRTLRDAQLNA